MHHLSKDTISGLHVLQVGVGDHEVGK